MSTYSGNLRFREKFSMTDSRVYFSTLVKDSQNARSFIRLTCENISSIILTPLNEGNFHIKC